MNAKRIIPMLLLLSVTLFAQSVSQDSQTAPRKKAAAESPSATADLANEVHELRRMMETQQQQIQQLQQAVQSRDQQIANLQNKYLLSIYRNKNNRDIETKSHSTTYR